MKNKILYLNIFSYNCKDCLKTCCRNGYLPLMNEELNYILRKHPYLKYHYKKTKRTHVIKKPETCWFLTQKQLCALDKKSNSKHKPSFCVLYPYRLINVHKNHFVLLPSLHCSGLRKNGVKNKIDRKTQMSIKKIISSKAYRTIKFTSKRYSDEKKLILQTKKQNKTEFIKFLLKHDNKTIETINLSKKLLSFIDIDLNKVANKKTSEELLAIMPIVRLNLYQFSNKFIWTVLICLYELVKKHEANNLLNKNSHSFNKFVLFLNQAIGLAVLGDKRVFNSVKKDLCINIDMIDKNTMSNFLSILSDEIVDIKERINFISSIGDYIIQYKMNSFF